jgi:uncharacterized protein (DUF983 family)
MSYEVLNGAGAPQERDAGQAMKRGLRCRCPACGEGRMFRSFLKVAPACERCGEDLSHERAEDFPPYITISIVAHVVLLGVVLAEQHAEWPMWLHFAIWPALTIILTFALMQPIKGAVVAYQWARRMHGFEGGAA